jgi:hypothetical protein
MVTTSARIRDDKSRIFETFQCLSNYEADSTIEEFKSGQTRKDFALRRLFKMLWKEVNLQNMNNIFDMTASQLQDAYP